MPAKRVKRRQKPPPTAATKERTTDNPQRKTTRRKTSINEKVGAKNPNATAEASFCRIFTRLINVLPHDEDPIGK